MYTNFSARAVGLSLTAGETIALAAMAAFEGVDLLVRDIVAQGTDPAELRARMDDRGLRGGGWPLPVDWKGSAERFARDLEHLPIYAATAAKLGLTRTWTRVLPETTDRPEGSSERAAHRAETIDWHVRRLGAIARVLDRFEVRLGLEVIGVESFRTGTGLPFVYRLSDLDAILGAVWSEAPNLGILLDGFQLHAAGEAIEAGLAWGVRRIVGVHVADLPLDIATVDRAAIRDADRGLPGESGAIEVGRLLSRLAELGYEGPVTAEPLSGCRTLAGRTPEEAARCVAAALNAVWPTTVSHTARHVPSESCR